MPTLQFSGIKSVNKRQEDDLTTLKKMRRTQFFSLRLRLQLALLPSSRGFAIWLLLISLIVATRTPSHAQGYPAGQPIVGNSINVLASSPLYLDVKQLSGADFCAQSTTAFAQTTPPSLIFNGIGESNGTTGTVCSAPLQTRHMGPCLK